MSTYFLISILVSSFILSLVCERSKAESEKTRSEARIIKVDTNPSDFSLPSKLWDGLLPPIKDDGTIKTVVEDGPTKAEIVFSPLRVRLIEKNPGVLVQPEIVFDFSKGGGEINLSDWMGPNTGGFFVRFELQNESIGASDHVFYLSKARKRKIGDLIVGAGCKTFLDIGVYLSSREVLNRGLAFNSTRNFHSSALLGHFIFSRLKEGKFYLSQVQFVDSKNLELACNEIKPSPGQSE